MTVVPAHPKVLAPAVAGQNLDHLALSARLADVPALNDDPVTCTCVHGEPPQSRGLLAHSDTAPAPATEQAGYPAAQSVPVRGVHLAWPKPNIYVG